MCTWLLLQVPVLCPVFDFRGAIERLSNILWVYLQGIQNIPKWTTRVPCCALWGVSGQNLEVKVLQNAFPHLLSVFYPQIHTQFYFINNQCVSVLLVCLCVSTLLLLHAFVMHNAGSEGFIKCCSSSAFTVFAWKSHNRSFYKPPMRVSTPGGLLCFVCVHGCCFRCLCCVLFFHFRGANERLSNILWVYLQGIQNEPPEYLVVLSGGSQAKI